MRTCALLTVLLASVSATSISGIELLDYIHNPEPKHSLKPRKTTADRIAAHGYPAETHSVVTEDGYIISMFRIPYSHKLQNQNAKRPIALIHHGLLSSSDGFVINGPNDAISFLLADAGFDVWLGNARGNTYSRNHTTTSVNHARFWSFSWHEIGHYDLAAMVDYALTTNGQAQQSVHYIGHSQATTSFLALLSTRPEYNAKIKTAHMLAPVGFMIHMTDQLTTTLSPYLGYTNIYAALYCGQEFLPYNELYMHLAYNTCSKESVLFGLCSGIAFMFKGKVAKMNVTALPMLVETHPAGSSTKQMCHYMQEQQSGRFCHYDYGSTKNMAVYGQVTPPDYPLHLITAELHLWYSDNDGMTAGVDVHKLANLLPNRVMHHMDDPLWAHGDFVFSLEAKKYVNDPIIAIMRDYENNSNNTN